MKERKEECRLKEQKGLQRISVLMVLMMVTVVWLSGCGMVELKEAMGSSSVVERDESSERVDTGFILTGPDSYDSADTAVLVDIDKDDSTVSFLNLDIGRRYTLSFDGTTKLYD